VNTFGPLLSRLAPKLAALAPAPVMIGHLGLPGSFADLGMDLIVGQLAPLRAASEYSNLFVKISATYALGLDDRRDVLREVVERVTDSFGARRLMWASNFPTSLNAVDERDLARDDLLSGLSAADQELIKFGTAQRMLEEANALRGPVTEK